VAGGDEGTEEGVANLAGGLFQGFAVLSGAGWNVGSVHVKRDVELNAEVLNEGEVGVGFGCFADAVMDVDGGEADAESVTLGCIGLVKSEQEGDGVGSSGDGDAYAIAGADVFAVEGECGCNRHETTE
jgi:hypothetical protein